MIQIQVEDTGIGIRKQDQDKLFKLFGFLDATKELNTKGVGLGLHISKKIINQFGGDVTCTSKWGVGTLFSFVVALEPKHEYNISNLRCLNPILKKTYAKIKLEPKKKHTIKKMKSI